MTIDSIADFDALARLDLLGLDDTLSGEDKLLRDTIRRFADEQLRPHIAEWFEAGTLPARELALEFGKLGVLGMHLDGYELRRREAEPVRAGLHRDRGGGLRPALAGQRAGIAGDVCHPRLRQRGAEAGMAAADGPRRGHRMFRPDRVRRGLGPRARCGPTRAGTATDWILHGSKMWITNGSISDVAIVWARTDEGIRGFLVERGTPGFTRSDVHHKVSLRASITSELSFDDVRLPASAQLPLAQGLRAPLGCLPRPGSESSPASWARPATRWPAAWTTPTAASSSAGRSRPSSSPSASWPSWP